MNLSLSKWLERGFNPDTLSFCERGNLPLNFSKYSANSLNELATKFGRKWESGEIERGPLLIEIYNSLSMTPD